MQSPVRTRARHLPVLAALLCMPAPCMSAQAALVRDTVDFEDPAAVGFYLPGDGLTQHGYGISVTDPGFATVDTAASGYGGSPLPPVGNATQFIGAFNDGRVRVARADQRAFSLTQLDFGFIAFDLDDFAVSPGRFRINGLDAMGSVVETRFFDWREIPASGDPFAFRTLGTQALGSLATLRFAVIEFDACTFTDAPDDLDACDNPLYGSGQFALDNLAFEYTTTDTELPAPTGPLLAGTGLVALLMARRRARRVRHPAGIPAGSRAQRWRSALAAAALFSLWSAVSPWTTAAHAAPARTWIVQLADAPLATYAGDVPGMAATRPARGQRLDVRSAAARAYGEHLNRRQAAMLAGIGNPRALHRYRVAFNGFAAQLTDAQVARLRAMPGVVSVTESQRLETDTSTTRNFLGLTAANGIWSQVDAGSRAVLGEDVIIGVLDSGIWPEDPAFGDRVFGGAPVAYTSAAGTLAYGPAPARWRGTCQAGPGFTAAMCNNKLLGARFYTAGYDAENGAAMYPREYRSPRDGDGHGSHTASTAGGNAGNAAFVGSNYLGVMSGVAPRSRIAAYKVCWRAPNYDFDNRTFCYAADLLRAIDDAIADGVDVLNVSIGGSPTTSFLDPTEIAFLNASTAGVFVAASAGNSGPGNQVDNIGPWITTVAASTHDRVDVAELALGEGAAAFGATTHRGPALFASALEPLPIVWGFRIPVEGRTADDARRCFPGALDPVGAAGRIVICDRGVNARVEKGQEVRRVGGVAMVLVNVPGGANDVVADVHVLPAVHLPAASRAVVVSYALNVVGATASLGPPASPDPVIAPVIADFSSRGPSLANASILKPDIAAPGVNVLASSFDGTLTQAERDEVAANLRTPNSAVSVLSGTSMAAPHVAGAAALLRQRYPAWSPAAIKSALMTTTTRLLLANGEVDTARFGFGAAHLNPNRAIDPGLVYDANLTDYGRFLCGLGLTPPTSAGTCASLGAILPWNLNLASITAASVTGPLAITRRVTNVTAATSTFTATALMPDGWTVAVQPSVLTLAPGATASYAVTITPTTAALGAWAFGSLTWNDGEHAVRSPISARTVPRALTTPAEVADTRVSGVGSKVFSVLSNYTGPLRIVPAGLVPATRVADVMAQGDATRCYPLDVPAGAHVVRIALFDTDVTTPGAVFALRLSNGTTHSAFTTTFAGGRHATIVAPPPGAFTACVFGVTLPSSGAVPFTLSTWIVGPATGTQSLRATGPASLTLGRQASIGLAWSVAAGRRYLGNVQFRDAGGAVVGTTIVSVNN